MMEETLVLIKPDGLERGLVGKILSRFEEKGLQLIGLKMLKMSEDLAGRHYASHKGKPFYPGLVAFMTSHPIVAMGLRGEQAIAVVRKMMGATFGPEAAPGTILGDFGVSKSFNLVHGSDSPESAARELGLFFSPAEICRYEPAIKGWVYDLKEEGH